MYGCEKWRIIMEISKIQYQIEGLLFLLNNYTVNIIDGLESPVFKQLTNTINIGNCEHWNQVYQLSHELLHAAFYEHGKGKNTIKYRWFEEILCEAFSIYCLKRYCVDEYPQWKLYLRPYMYYLNGNCKTREIISSENIDSLLKLNDKLKDKKSYETLQYIHPLCLLIVNVLDDNIGWLQEILDFTKFLNIDYNNEIIFLIKDFIKTKQLI